MNWLRANRLSAKDPVNQGSYDLNMRSSVDNKKKASRNLDLTTP